MPQSLDRRPLAKIPLPASTSGCLIKLMEREKSALSNISIILARNAACHTVHGFGQDVEWAGEKTLGRCERHEEEIVGRSKKLNARSL